MTNPIFSFSASVPSVTLWLTYLFLLFSAPFVNSVSKSAVEASRGAIR